MMRLYPGQMPKQDLMPMQRALGWASCAGGVADKRRCVQTCIHHFDLVSGAA